MDIAEELKLTDQELNRISEVAGFSAGLSNVEKDSDRETLMHEKPDEAICLVRTMAEIAYTNGGDAFAKFAYSNRKFIEKSALENSEVLEMLLLCYRLGVSQGSGVCMNNLGSLYYLGSIVEQDYEKASELYQMAVDAGFIQSSINLGYVYEYGRIGKPDYGKAFECYSFAAALMPTSEAMYKLGDMFARGQGVTKNTERALLLYEKSLDLTSDIVGAAQPSFRIAEILIDIEFNPVHDKEDVLRALELFQKAELGLRIDVDDGQVYYSKRLKMAIEGQERARKLLEQNSNQ